MLERVSNKIADKWVRMSIIESEYKQVYSYGIALLLSSLIGISLILILGLIISSILHSLIFLVVFIPVRFYFGGYHAKRFVTCNLISVSVFVSVLVLAKSIGITLPHEMTLEDFQRLKWVLTESTRAEFNREWLVTYRNVSFELLEQTHVVSLPSVEEVYMSKLTMELEACNMTARTMANALRIIKQANLTKMQRQRYLKYKYLNHSTRDIAREEGVDQKSVWESIATAEKKISKQLSKIKEL